jgi:hypothetical protein
VSQTLNPHTTTTHQYVNGFLSNRTLQVRINNTCSDIYIVQNGTPQGSCISPTLFNIMVNDLSSCIKNCEMSQFAYCIWFDHVNLQSNIIPRNLTSLTISSICVPIFKTNLPNFRFLEKI